MGYSELINMPLPPVLADPFNPSQSPLPGPLGLSKNQAMALQPDPLVHMAILGYMEKFDVAKFKQQSTQLRESVHPGSLLAGPQL